MIVHEEAAREVLGIGHGVCRPIKGVAAVVDCAAALWCIMHGTQKLPLARSHLRAGGGAAGRLIEQETNNEVVALCNQKAAKLVQPDRLIDMGRGRRKNLGRLPGDGSCVAGGMMPMKCCQVLLELEG